MSVKKHHGKVVFDVVFFKELANIVADDSVDFASDELIVRPLRAVEAVESVGVIVFDRGLTLY